jgi:hypothetical protein
MESFTVRKISYGEGGRAGKVLMATRAYGGRDSGG